MTRRARLDAVCRSRGPSGSSLARQFRQNPDTPARQALIAFNSAMTDERSVASLAEALPSTGDMMALVGNSWWKCAYAARGGNWALAAYFARRVRSLQRKVAARKAKYRERLEAFEAEMLVPLFAAIETADRDAFERIFADATARANRSHVETGYGYIRWTLPSEPPKDLDLGPGSGRGGSDST